MDSPQQIDGYRKLTSSEVEIINGLKHMEANVRSHLGDMEAHLRTLVEQDESDQDDLGDLLRWVDIARTHFETGFMFAIKAIARPTNGLGRR
jgi:hypothetical protein